jgi:hypothetical protein
MAWGSRGSRQWREMGMSWTDDRVTTLKKLWLDGLSASQIAKQLGGVTRNAVIGKVHRLGLSGRAAPSQPARPAFKAPRPARPAAQTMPSAPRRVVATEQSAPTPMTASASPCAAVAAGLSRRATRLGHRADPGRPHVQVADRRSLVGRLHLLRSPLVGRPLLRRARPGGLPAATIQEEGRPDRAGPLAAPLHLDLDRTHKNKSLMRPSPFVGEGLMLSP